MNQKNNLSRQELKFEVMDVCNMTYANEFFDIIIDKSTSDAIFCAENAYFKIA